jgi:hypothetical protein
MMRLAEASVAGALFGLTAAFLFRRLVSGSELRRTADRLMADLLELRLYLDEPGIVLRAQARLFRDNLRVLALFLAPTLVCALLFAILYVPLDRMVGRGSLLKGETVIITAPLGAPAPQDSGLTIETPAVRIPRLGIAAWRAHADASGTRLPPGYSAALPETPISGLSWETWFALSAAIFSFGASFWRGKKFAAIFELPR